MWHVARGTCGACSYSLASPSPSAQLLLTTARDRLEASLPAPLKGGGATDALDLDAPEAETALRDPAAFWRRLAAEDGRTAAALKRADDSQESSEDACDSDDISEDT